MDSDSKHTVKTTQGYLKILNVIPRTFHSLNTKPNAETPTNKQLTIAALKGLAKHHIGRHSFFGDMYFRL